ncbi:hypothetical protein [Kribbella sp. DT2]|uniref:hypothetical protein n=1 Tax=Kribbella sp. DT2 TaxID=3393427 RepID=UPI003CE7F9FE
MRILLLLAGVLLLQATSLGTAAADGGPTGQDQSFAQSLGDRELTVIVRRVETIPGPLRVDVVTHRGTPPGTLTLALVPRDAADNLSAPGQATAHANVQLGPRPDLYGATLRVDRPGPWELELSDGRRTARIPFALPAKVIPPAERVAYGGFVAAGGCLLCALFAATRGRRAGVAMVATGGMIAAIAVAVTGALLSPTIRPPAAPGSETDATLANTRAPYAPVPRGDLARPPVNIQVQAPRATIGRRTEMRLLLTDGATGRPVDDLLPHHGALMHLVVISPAGQMSHLHPIRVAAGEYRVELTPYDAGRFAVSVELARRGGGTQLIRPTGFTVAGPAQPPQTPEPPGTRTVDGTKLTITTDRLAAGSATTITVTVDAALQLWLGMQGHLIVAGPVTGSGFDQVPVWLHGHAMAPGPVTANPPDETVAAFGPEVRFTTTFPYPGRYHLWIQVERDFAVLTVPLVLDVPLANGEQR